jgi:hypothetical protein
MTGPTLPKTPRPFAAWLRTAPLPTREIGVRGFPYTCPLAHYLRTKGAESPSVEATAYWVDRHTRRITPPWACAFLATLDAAGREGTPVTAEEALAILNTITLPEKETPDACARIHPAPAHPVP